MSKKLTEIDGRKILYADAFIYEDEINLICGYESFIKKHIEAGNKIPARVLKVYFGLIKGGKKFSEIHNEQKSKLLTNDALKQFTNYTFSGSTKKKLPMFGKLKYSIYTEFHSLEDMFNNTFLYLLNESDEIRSKDEYIIAAYTRILSYRDKINRSCKSIITDYAAISMSGYMASKLGFGLSEIHKNKTTNEHYYQSARNAINKARKLENG